MSKHTPGPWVNRGPRSLYDDYQIWSRSYPDVARVSNEHDEETQANARLIAAAPELYEALCRMSYIFMQVVQAVEIDIEGTRFEVENKATGEKGHLSLQEVFEAASSAINKVHGETNE